MLIQNEQFFYDKFDSLKQLVTRGENNWRTMVEDGNYPLMFGSIFKFLTSFPYWWVGPVDFVAGEKCQP